MAGAVSGGGADQKRKELVSHGTTMFPLGCYEEDLANYSVPWHWHEEFEFILVQRGVLEVNLENEKIFISPGQGIFINSGVLHATDHRGSVHGKFCSLVFHARLIGGSIDSVFWQKLIQPVQQDSSFRYLYLAGETGWQQKVLRSAAAAWEAVHAETEDYENVARYELSRAFRFINANRAAAGGAVSGQARLAEERMKRMLQYIEEHYREDMTAAEIAGSISVSESVCLRCFHQVIGTTPIQYVKQLRLQKAAGLLGETDMKVNRIATECGFSDISYFTRIFREKTGDTPLEYRKKVKNGSSEKAGAGF